MTFTQPGGHADVIADLVRRTVTDTAANAPRSRQRAIGPSEIGSPCTRRIGYKLAGVPAVNDGGDPWASVVGTAVHAWLGHAFLLTDVDRYQVEEESPVTDTISGRADLYDSETKTVIDHKVVGETAMRRYRISGPGQQYRSQVHLYAHGLTRKGIDVEHVAIVCYPRSGHLGGLHVWTEPYDPVVAEQALTRLEAIKRLVDVAGTAALPMLPTADAFCSHCPWFDYGSADTQTRCPGHGSATGETAA